MTAEGHHHWPREDALFCRRQNGPLEPVLGLPGSATTHTGRYTAPRPSGKLHPHVVGGAADGRYGGSPEGQTVTRAVPSTGSAGNLSPAVFCVGVRLPPAITQAQDAMSIEGPAPRSPLIDRALSEGRVL